MSMLNSSRKWRRFGRVVGLILAVLEAAVSMASARSLPAHASVYARSAKAAEHASAAAGRAAGQVLVGFTSQGLRIGAQIAKTGRRITAVETALDMSCGSGIGFLLPVFWARLPIRAAARFTRWPRSLLRQERAFRSPEEQTPSARGLIAGGRPCLACGSSI